MVNLKKHLEQPEKVDEDFISGIDAFIKEMKNLKNAIRPKKSDDDIKFERNMRTINILMYILWAEIGILIGLDIFLIIDKFFE